MATEQADKVATEQAVGMAAKQAARNGSWRHGRRELCSPLTRWLGLPKGEHTLGIRRLRAGAYAPSPAQILTETIAIIVAVARALRATGFHPNLMRERMCTPAPRANMAAASKKS